MSFSFDETLPTDLDYVRFKLSDADPEEQILSNETINALLSQYGLERSLVEGCNAIKLFYGKEATTIGLTAGRRFQYADRYKAYAALYDELKAEYGVDASADGTRIDVLPLPLEDEFAFSRVQPFYRGY